MLPEGNPGESNVKSKRPSQIVHSGVHILFSGYVEVVPPPALGHISSTVSFVRDGEIRVIIDPGQVPHLKNILEPLAALGESPASITDVIFSHHHPDHTLNAALFPFSGESALYLVYSL